MVNFIIVLSVLVLVHELGHFLAARYFNVTVESFSIGFGPRVLGFRRNGTEYKVCLLPLGGYVKMAGGLMDGGPSGDPGELDSKPRWQRLIIALMGPVFNFLLAFVLLAGLYMYSYQRFQYLDEEPRLAFVEAGSGAAAAGLRPGDLIRSLDGIPVPTWLELTLSQGLAAGRVVDVEYERAGSLMRSEIEIVYDEVTRIGRDPGWTAQHAVQITRVYANSPAATAGLQVGDMILRVNGEDIVAIRQVGELIGASAGSAVPIVVERGGQQVALEALAERDEASGQLIVGIAMQPLFEKASLSLPFGEAVAQSLRDNLGFASLIARAVGKLVTGDLSLKSLEGPVGIYEHTQTAASYGIAAFLQFMALISVNLGIVNLAPVPVLDGGHILMLLIESTLRRDVSQVVKLRINQVGLVFILLLICMVMYNDVTRQLFLR